MGAADPSTQERSGERDTGLRRAIGGRLLFFFILGDILGGGIYSLPGEVAAEVGGAIWVPFTVAFVLALLTACSYAELVTKYPLRSQGLQDAVCDFHGRLSRDGIWCYVGERARQGFLR